MQAAGSAGSTVNPWQFVFQGHQRSSFSIKVRSPVRVCVHVFGGWMYPHWHYQYTGERGCSEEGEALMLGKECKRGTFDVTSAVM